MYIYVLLSLVWMSKILVKTFITSKNLQYFEIILYGYSRCHFQCTECTTARLKSEYDQSVGGHIEKLMYNNQNLVVTGILQVLKLNSIEQACRWNAVHTSYFHKYEGEEQNNFYWERE